MHSLSLILRKEAKMQEVKGSVVTIDYSTKQQSSRVYLTYKRQNTDIHIHKHRAHNVQEMTWSKPSWQVTSLDQTPYKDLFVCVCDYKNKQKCMSASLQQTT